MSPLRTALLAAVLALLPVAAGAQDPAETPHDPGAHRHLGFFLRLDGGIGFLGTSAYVNDVAASVSGVSIPFGAVAGWAVAENLVVAGDFFFTLAPTPVFSYGGRNETPSDSGLSLLGIGPHLTWYFMPDNIYVSVTPALVIRTLRSFGNYEGARVGFGAKIAVGEEWWIADHWGLGVAAQFFLGLNQGSGAYERLWTTLGGGLALSATYN